MNKEAQVLRVTMTVDFIIEDVSPDGTTNINGWPIERVVEDWFERGRINQSHASRSSHELGHGKRFLDYKLLTAEEAIS